MLCCANTRIRGIKIFFSRAVKIILTSEDEVVSTVV